jgi:uncharacterized membrane protein
MWMLVSGLALFFLAHLIPTFPNVRTRLVGVIGRGPYAGLFSLVSFVSLVLVVWGYGAVQGLGRANPQLWVTPAWMRHVTMLLMFPALILLVAAYTPSRIRTVVRHPMLTAVMVWSLSHLLVNGDLASVILFGSFLAYAVYDVVSASQRNALGPLGSVPGGVVGDVVAIAGGLGVYVLLLFWGHQKLTGVPLLL